MHRNILIDMKEWLGSEGRKPLILRGARQVGKTWLVRELAKLCNKKLIELNFEKNRDLAIHFESNDPSRILLNLESALNQTIDVQQSLLFLDEIQAIPELLARLRWFYEDMPELPVIAAGSLLEFVLENHEFSMPVGRIQYFFVEPLGFEEFLLAKNETHLLSAIENVTLKDPLNEALHQKANQLYLEYLMVGGMPEAVSNWVSMRSVLALESAHHHLLNTYQDDFSKYAGRLSIEYLHDVFRAVPQQLTKKFTYSHVNGLARTASIKQALNLLEKSYVCHLVQSTSANGIPLGAEIHAKVFKMIFLDVGLVSTLLGLRLHEFKNLDDILVINKGALAEQGVGQALRLLTPFYVEPRLFYWCREAQNSSAEIDYLIQYQQNIIPIEVKSGSEGKLRSLHQFMHEKSWEYAIRIYSGKLQQQTIHLKTVFGKEVHYELLSLPFYLLRHWRKIINFKI